MHALTALVPVDWKLHVSPHQAEVANALRVNLLNVWPWMLELEVLVGQCP